MVRSDHSNRARVLLEMARQRSRMNATPSASTSPIIQLDSPPDTPRPTKRQRTIKVEDDLDIFVPTDPKSLPEDVLELDPKAEEGPPPPLDDEQRDAVKLILQGKNVFITGPAGCGKSAVLRWAIMLLRSKGKVVYCTAPTGQAAQLIGGSTLSSYMGFGKDINKKPIKEISRRAEIGAVRERIEATDVLIIDEISMVGNHMFDRVNRALQSARGNDEPCGGLQIILSGDFFQLPPVKPFETCFTCGKPFDGPGRKMVNGKKINTWECTVCDTEAELDTHFWAFNSQSWESAKLVNVHLTRNHRQIEGSLMDIILGKVRKGIRLDVAEQVYLRDHPANSEGAIRLFPNKANVKAHNDRMLEEMPGQARRYVCHDDFRHNEAHANVKHRSERSQDGSLMYQAHHQYEGELRLKQGMPVVLLANLDVENGLVNGSQGQIVGFQSYREAAIPNAAGVDLTPGADGDGEIGNRQFVARKWGGDYAIIRQEQVKRFITKDENSHSMWPVVRFKNGKEILILPNCSMTQLGHEKPYTLEMRTQIPLVPGWAMTFHKAQGATLDSVVLNLGNCFAVGMLYVALSRVKTLGGMLIEDIGDAFAKASADQEVINFYNSRIWDVGRFV